MHADRYHDHHYEYQHQHQYQHPCYSPTRPSPPTCATPAMRRWTSDCWTATSPPRELRAETWQVSGPNAVRARAMMRRSRACHRTRDSGSWHDRDVDQRQLQVHWRTTHSELKQEKQTTEREHARSESVVPKSSSNRSSHKTHASRAVEKSERTIRQLHAQAAYNITVTVTLACSAEALVSSWPAIWARS